MFIFITCFIVAKYLGCLTCSWWWLSLAAIYLLIPKFKEESKNKNE